MDELIDVIAIVIGIILVVMILDTFIFWERRYFRKVKKEWEKELEEKAKGPKPTYVFDSIFPSKEE